MTAELENQRPDFFPNWWICKRRAEQICPGIQIGDFDGCLQHLTSDERAQFLNTLHPGVDLDVRGTQLSKWLIDELMSKFSDPEISGCARVGKAQFDRATFVDDTSFDYAQFDGNVSFSHARFDRNVSFSHTRFQERVDFSHTQFDHVTLRGSIRAKSVTWHDARFTQPVELKVAADWMSYERTVFERGAVLLLDGTEIDLSEAKFGAPSSVVGDTSKRSLPAVTSLRGVDVSELALTNLDLRWCQFGGAYRLDQIRIEGRCQFNNPPPSRRWTRRQVLFEECRWREMRDMRTQWRAPALNPVPKPTEWTEPEKLAILYRSLRKSLEDGKNEAGAGDFYYGEMEARRHSSKTNRTERLILTAYWLLSGYGQRAWRSLVALAVLLMIVTGVLISWGLPQPAQQQVTGTIQTGQATLAIAEPPAALPPASQRWTLARAERAMQISLGAVVFRDVGQKLTSAGTWTVMLTRVCGPLLLALAVLAIRARVKR